MATHQMSIMSGRGNVDGAYWQPASILGVNDYWDHLVLIMNDDGSNIVYYHDAFLVPQDYVDNAKFIVVWTANVTSNNAKFDVNYRAVGGNDTESLDQATAQESVTVTDAAPSAVHERLTAEMTPTAGNFAAGDTVQYRLELDAADAACTIADDCIIHDIIFEYTDA